ncbi:MAG: NusG domain II-containing protein [Candidatus Cellulosilyticum pullistercoris]|uniref:NusG domain II-containing protein n=1 Tax=Candidatus Cellulosilyticum pullistercoris TaxID=2838521 RepID=A0A9E2KEV2_9FIRM|nr:NusG domain II-containing protein [Candidatus Cellulosilyticum pullistercoris]
MKIKLWDKIIIALLLVISFIPYLFLKMLMPSDYDMIYARITIQGKLYKEIPLTGQVKQKEFIIDTGHGINKAVIENEAITITEADCPDEICTQTGFIDKPGQSITCLPHKLHIEIVGKSLDSTEKDEDIIDVNAY